MTAHNGARAIQRRAKERNACESQEESAPVAWPSVQGRATMRRVGVRASDIGFEEYRLAISGKTLLRLNVLSQLDIGTRAARLLYATRAVARAHVRRPLSDDERAKLCIDDAYVRGVTVHLSDPMAFSGLLNGFLGGGFQSSFVSRGISTTDAFLRAMAKGDGGLESWRAVRKRILAAIGRDYPSVAGRLQDGVAKDAAEAWLRIPGAKRTSVRQPLKWDAAARLVDSLGIGVRPAALKTEWRGWDRYPWFDWAWRMAPMGTRRADASLAAALLAVERAGGAKG